MNAYIKIVEDELSKWEADARHPFMNKGCKGAVRALKYALVQMRKEEEREQAYARAVLEQSTNPTCAVPRPFVDWEEK
jgi:hypothetical protein